MNPYKIGGKKYNKIHHPEASQIWGVDGPGGHVAFNYYSDLKSPKYSFESEDSAQAACDIANAAYGAGYSAAKTEIRKALGL